MTTPPAPPPAAPQKSSSGNRTLIIILGVLLGFMLIMGGCVVACTYFVKSKAEEFSQNPELSAIKFAVKFAPDIEVVEEDTDAGTITLRNTKTGETVDLNVNDYTQENIGMAIAEMMEKLEAGGSDENSSEEYGPEESEPETVTIEERAPAPTPAKARALEAAVERLPDFVTPYPDGTTMDATSQTFGNQSVGSYVFSTEDTPEEVVAFYEEALTKAGFTTVSSGFGTNDNGSTANYAATRPDGSTMFILQAESQSDGTVSVNVSATVTNN